MRDSGCATSPCRAFINKPQLPFPNSYLISFLLNLTHTSVDRRRSARLMDRQPSAFVTMTCSNYVSTPFLKANSQTIG